MPVPSFDVHQHLWPDEVLAALSSRSEPPFARLRDGMWEVQPVSEPAFEVVRSEHEPEERVEALAAVGVDQALVALSATIGIEELAPRESDPIVNAWDAAGAQLPSELRAWATLPLADPDPARVATALNRGAVGLCLPAGALSDPRSIERLGPVLQLLEWRLAPLFVHPGPPGGGHLAASGWWDPCTTYVAELHAAWHAFMAWGRPAHPSLRVVFAALAGLAPLHAERTAVRGGPVLDEVDPLTFYDVSTYGPRAIGALAAEIGYGQLVFGTDIPVVAAPALEASTRHEILARDNAERLLGLAWVAA